MASHVTLWSRSYLLLNSIVHLSNTLPHDCAVQVHDLHPLWAGGSSYLVDSHRDPLGSVVSCLRFFVVHTYTGKVHRVLGRWSLVSFERKVIAA